MTVRTRAQLNSDADTNLADNTSGDIGADDVRASVKNLADSALLGEDIGTHVQAYHARLASLAGLAFAAGDLIYATGSNTLARLAKGTDGQVLTLASGNPAWAAAPETGGVGLMKITSAEQTSTSQTLADISDLSFAIGANETWSFQAQIFTTQTASGTVCLSVNGPASPASVEFTVFRTFMPATAGSAMALWSEHTAYDAVNTTQTGNSQEGVAFVSGKIVNGATAGTVALRMRRAGTSNPAKVRKNSTLLAWKD